MRSRWSKWYSLNMTVACGHQTRIALLFLWISALVSCAEPVCLEPGPDEPPPCELTPFSNPCPVDQTIEPPDAELGDCTRLDDGAECVLETALCFDQGICLDGECIPALNTEKDCSSAEDAACEAPCCSISCNPTNGECDLFVRSLPGDWCNSDTDVCTLEQCDEEGVCQATGDFITCQAEKDLNPCSTWQCKSEEGCVEGPFDEGNPCDDGDPCTGPDLCKEAVNGCVGEPLAELDDQNICTTDTCDDGTIVHDPLICDQPVDLCLGVNVCDPDGAVAQCLIDPVTVVVCDEPQIPCTFNQCNGGTGNCEELTYDDGTFCCVDTVISNAAILAQQCPGAEVSGICLEGQCDGACVPNCGEISCGVNGCECGYETTCNTFCGCPNGQVCNKGLCEEPCIPNCVANGTNCGDDGCGGSCGSCIGCDGLVDPSLCTGGTCIEPCCPDCANKVCGDDGCGDVCGSCQGCDGPDNALCLPNGTCDDTPNDCKALTVCAAHCAGDGTCANVCVEEACDNAKTDFAAWGSCIIAECPAGLTAPCIQTAANGPCAGEMTTCTEVPTPTSDCFQIVTCQAGCNSSACANNCHDQAPVPAQALHDAWQTCILQKCGIAKDTACWEEADAGQCSPQMNACLAP